MEVPFLSKKIVKQEKITTNGIPFYEFIKVKFKNLLNRLTKIGYQRKDRN